MPHSRRKFVKYFALGVATSSALGRYWDNAVLAAVNSPNNGIGKFSVKISDFPALQNELGSVRFGFTPINGDEPPSNGLYPVIINRGAGDTFYALDSECRHQSCPVRPYREEFGGAPFNAMPCFCHGSLYSIEGVCFAGPADGLELRKYAITYDGNDTLTVEVPSWTFSIASIAGAGQRLKLEFPTLYQVKYKIQFRSSVSGGAWANVNFALTPDGPLTQTELEGDALTATVYVEPAGQQGYYAAVQQIIEVPDPDA